jgi:hypothetical protein
MYICYVMQTIPKITLSLVLLLGYVSSYAQLKNTLSFGINSDYRYVITYERKAKAISFQIGVSQFSSPNLTNKEISSRYFDSYNMNLDTSFVSNVSKGFNFFINAKKEFGIAKVRPFVSAGLRVGKGNGGHSQYMEYCATGLNLDQVQISLSRSQFRALFIGGGLVYQPIDRFSLNLTLGIAQYRGSISNEDKSLIFKNNGWRIEAPQLLAIGFHF